jgi:DNA-3-methyladenine glycosylase II
MGDAIDIERYLSRRDPDLGRAIAIVRAARGDVVRPPRPTDSPFQALVRAVIYQRSSEASGQTVFGKLEKVAGGKLTPANVAALSPARVEKVGMPLAKARYVKNVASWFVENAGTARRLKTMSNQEIYDALMGIVGLGTWSINVLLVFNLGRLDVEPAIDPVIRKIAQKIYGLDQFPSASFVSGKVAKWRPYRSIATMYLYQLGKLKVSAAEIRAGRTKVDLAAMRSGT